MSYSTTSFLLYGVKTTEFVEETTLRELGLPELCPYSAGNGCSGDLEYFVAVNDTVEFISSYDEYSKSIPFIQYPAPEKIDLLDKVPSKCSTPSWWLISEYS